MQCWKPNVCQPIHVLSTHSGVSNLQQQVHSLDNAFESRHGLPHVPWEPCDRPGCHLIRCTNAGDDCHRQSDCNCNCCYCWDLHDSMHVLDGPGVMLPVKEHLGICQVLLDDVTSLKIRCNGSPASVLRGMLNDRTGMPNQRRQTTSQNSPGIATSVIHSCMQWIHTPR